MGKKLYEQEETGGICFKSERQPGEVRIPNYVYDLWLPLLGATAIGVYAVYARLERQGVTKGKSLRELAASCRVGDRKLGNINAALAECGFIRLKKPEGHTRQMHYTTEITVLDPPDFISKETVKKYAPPSGYKTLSPWLVEAPETPGDVLNETPNDVTKVATLSMQPSLIPAQAQNKTSVVSPAAVPSESEKNEAFNAEMLGASKRLNAQPPKHISAEQRIADTRAASARGWARTNYISPLALERALERYGDVGPSLRELQKQISIDLGLEPDWSNKRQVKSWVSGLKEAWVASGESMPVIVQTIKRLRGGSMTISSPRSLVNTARAIAAERATAYVAPSARAVREYV